MSEKMKCNVIRDILPSYVDDICSDESRGYVEEHVKTCAECRGILEAMKADIMNIGAGNDISIDDKKILMDVKDKMNKELRRKTLVYRIICALLIVVFLLLVLPIKVIPAGSIDFNVISLPLENVLWVSEYSFLDADEGTIFFMDNDTNIDEAKFYQVSVDLGYGYENLFLEEKWAKEHDYISFVFINSDYVIKDYQYHIENQDGKNVFVLDKATTSMLAGTGKGSYTTPVALECSIDEAR